MKKYLFMFVAFCLCVLATPYVYALLPQSLRAEEVSSPAADRVRAVECICCGEKTVMPQEEYVARVLTEKGYALFPAEALKAMACIVRTRAVTGDIAELAYADPPAADAVAAAVSTAWMYIAYDGSPVKALSHVSSRSFTVGADEAYGENIPYLQSVPTPEYERGALTADERFFGADELAAILTENGYRCDTALRLSGWLTYAARSESGRIMSVRLCGNAISGRKLASMLGLASSYFEISVTDGGFDVKTYGSGDGVGLSELGACVMAQSGKRFDEILLHYYPGTCILLNNTP